MDDTRYRLTGAVVLLAAAAVAVPMLFDGEGVQPMHLDALSSADFEVDRDTSPVPDMSAALVARRELKAAIDDDAYARDTGVRFGEPVLVSESDAAATNLKWAVQVASFVRPENAKALRDRLLADGYAAFLSSVRREAQVSTRVAVGPLVNRDDAAQLKGELDKLYRVDAVVVGFTY